MEDLLEQREALVICRGGLEEVVARELEILGVVVVALGRRAVEVCTDKGGLYRCNMALRCALNVLVPLRTFNARNYDMLYYQSRKTNWHKLFPPDATLRIDVKGHSGSLHHTRFVIHRVKDGITDTFRKLAGGRRPSIARRDPEVHVVVYLDGTRVTLALDTSGVPLFKRGYRAAHGEAPLKEDLAAGIVALSGWDRSTPLLDPMCGSGTLLFEAWMAAARIAPNLDRRFGFERLLDYDRALHQQERRRLEQQKRLPPPGFKLTGWEIDGPTCATARAIRDRFFPGAPVEIEHADFRHRTPDSGARSVVCNPPYGVRLGEEQEISALYDALGRFLERHLAGGRAAIFTANHAAAGCFGGDLARSVPLRNGALEGRLYEVRPPCP